MSRVDFKTYLTTNFHIDEAEISRILEDCLVKSIKKDEIVYVKMKYASMLFL
jgi:hypothetical protein